MFWCYDILTFRLVSDADADGNYVGDAAVDRNSGVITIGPSTDFVTVIVQVWIENFFLEILLNQPDFFLEILLNQPEIRLYLPFSDWFKSKRASVWIQIYRKMVNAI